jgi:hypothetical protein
VAETADRMMGCERGGHGAFSVPVDIGRRAVVYRGGVTAIQYSKSPSH